MQELLKHYIPQKAIPLVLELLVNDNLEIKVKNERKTRHGDYRRLKNGKHQITVNSNLNHYRFLMTLIHEVAHFETYKTYGHYIKPHGVEWKRTFQHLMLPFLNPQIFPNHLLSILAKHLNGPMCPDRHPGILQFVSKSAYNLQSWKGNVAWQAFQEVARG